MILIKAMQFVTDVLLFFTAIILIIILTPINYFFVDKRSRYSRGIAFSLDVFGNIQFSPLFNSVLITKGGYKFGNQQETISAVLGHNIKIEKLSKIGKIVVQILTEKHCLDAANLS